MKHLLTIAFCLILQNGIAQLDLTLPLSAEIIDPQIEFKLKGSYYLATSIKYAKWRMITFDIDTLTNRTITYKQNFYEGNLYFRKYFGKSRKEGKGFYLNSFNRIRIIRKYNQDYLDYLERRGFGEPLRKPVTNLDMGLGLGYKWVIFKRFVISPQIKTSVNILDIREGEGGPLTEFQLRLGYRFGKIKP